MNFSAKIIFLSASLFCIGSLSSCRHEPVLPDKQVSFSADIIPIIGGSCQASGCHGSSGGEFPLVTYDDMMHDEMIVPNEPYKSNIYKTVISQDKSTVMPVPPLKPLTEQQIETLFIWIKQGALNN